MSIYDNNVGLGGLGGLGGLTNQSMQQYMRDQLMAQQNAYALGQRAMQAPIASPEPAHMNPALLLTGDET